MISPTPQDLERARELVRGIFNNLDSDPLLHIDEIVSALAEARAEGIKEGQEEMRKQGIVDCIRSMEIKEDK